MLSHVFACVVSSSSASTTNSPRNSPLKLTARGAFGALVHGLLHSSLLSTSVFALLSERSLRSCIRNCCSLPFTIHSSFSCSSLCSLYAFCVLAIGHRSCWCQSGSVGFSPEGSFPTPLLFPTPFISRTLFRPCVARECGKGMGGKRYQPNAIPQCIAILSVMRIALFPSFFKSPLSRSPLCYSSTLAAAAAFFASSRRLSYIHLLPLSLLLVSLLFERCMQTCTILTFCLFAG